MGLVYIYQAASVLKFVQFISDGKNFTAKEPADGPTNIAFDLKVVVGDLNSNGLVICNIRKLFQANLTSREEDVFVLSPKTKEGRKYCHFLSCGPPLATKPSSMSRMIPWCAQGKAYLGWIRPPSFLIGR